MTDRPETTGQQAASLIALARHGIPPDMQEVLIYGDPSRGVRPGALAAAIAAALVQHGPLLAEHAVTVARADAALNSIGRLRKQLSTAAALADCGLDDRKHPAWRAEAWGVLLALGRMEDAVPAEIERLCALVVQLGGDPYAK